MKFSDLARKAASRRVHLKDAYRAIGLNYTTFWRHVSGRSRPTPRTALLLSDAIEKLGGEEEFKEAWQGGVRRQFIRLRKARQMTQGAVEDALGVTSALIGKYEANMRTPNAFILCCWAERLDGRIMVIPNEIAAQVEQLVEGFYASR